MNPALILFGIKSIIRLGKVGRDALEQHYRDSGAPFPDIADVEVKSKIYVTGFFDNPGYREYVEGPDAPYAEYWGASGVIDKPEAIDTLLTLALKIKADEGVDLKQQPASHQAKAGIVLIKQWAPDKGPISPFARVVMTAGDIALEYIGSNPSILGIGGNGEKLLGAFATNLSELLPNDGNFGSREHFAERLLGVFLKAGFKVIEENPDWVTSEDHLKELIAATVTPLMTALPQNSIAEQHKFETVVDALIGPVAGAAMETLAKNPEAFFGNGFKPGTVMGSLSTATITEAAKDGLTDQFTKEGLFELYKAALNVAVEQPEIFIGHGGKPNDQLARELLSRCAEKLKAAKPPFDGRVGTQLAAAVMDAIGKNAHNFAGEGKHWEQTAADIIEEITRDLGGAFEQNKNLKTVFTKDQLVDLGRIVLTRVSSTPSMIIGPKEAVGEVVNAVALAMLADKKLLLSGDDWVEIVKAAADEAAENPARLFKLDPANNNQALAVELITGILDVAGEIFIKPEPPEQPLNLEKYTVLFGKTLKETIITVIQNASGNLVQANKNKGSIFDLVKKLNKFIAKNPGSFGSKEYLRLFKKLLANVLNDQNVPTLDNIEEAQKLLT